MSKVKNIWKEEDEVKAWLDVCPVDWDSDHAEKDFRTITLTLTPIEVKDE